MAKKEGFNSKQRIAIIGGGPAGLFMFKRLVESGNNNIIIDVFEKKMQLGAGMPYSSEGANAEHITNVSDNEIPELVISIGDWLKTVPANVYEPFDLDPEKFNEYKVLPRLLFGQYLTAQFGLLRIKADIAGIETRLHPGTRVTDITDRPEKSEVQVEANGKDIFTFDRVIICSGHNWPAKYEGIIAGYYDSPYPPSKLGIHADHPVAIKGSSLTAIDAIRTLARHNGSFEKDADQKLSYRLSDKSPRFKMVMHSRSGMLPAVRFHLEDSHLSNKSLLTPEEIAAHISANDGFLSLDFIFEKDFKDIFRDKDPEFYERIRDMRIEDFVASMIALRERLDPFTLLKAEYAEAEKSIKRKESVYWKEMLAVLSFAMNYPAKHFSAEDMMRLQKVLMPLISIVIAFVPQGSCDELLALHDAGVLELITVGDESKAEPQDSGGIIYSYTNEENEKQEMHYQTFVDCVGQPHLSYDDIPFKSLITGKSITPARLKFRSNEAAEILKENKNIEQDGNGDYFLKVSGISINDKFRIHDQYGAFNERLYMMAVPYIGGFNPDYSGLDFCAEASGIICKAIFED